MSKKARFVVLAQSELLSRLKFTDLATALSAAGEEAEKSREPHYTVEILYTTQLQFHPTHNKWGELPTPEQAIRLPAEDTFDPDV